MSRREQNRTRVLESSNGGAATVNGQRGDLVGLPVASDRELLVAHSTPEAPVPMEVDPQLGFHLLGT